MYPMGVSELAFDPPVPRKPRRAVYPTTVTGLPLSKEVATVMVATPLVSNQPYALRVP
jgi:hypothetical protein